MGLGAFPFLSLQDARTEALAFISEVKSGRMSIAQSRNVTLQILLDTYTSGDRLKPRTVRDYQESIGFYLSDWLELKASEITREMVEKRFYLIRDKGFNGGIPTYSQATKDDVKCLCVLVQT